MFPLMPVNLYRQADLCTWVRKRVSKWFYAGCGLSFDLGRLVFDNIGESVSVQYGT